MADDEKVQLISQWIDQLGLDEVLLIFADAVLDIPPASASYDIKKQVAFALKRLAKLDAF